MTLRRGLAIVSLLIGIGGLAQTGYAQQRIGYVDTQYIFQQLPEYAAIQQKLDKLEKKWRSEIQDRREKLEQLRKEYQAWELLYTEEERKQKNAAIQKAQTEIERLREQYFGPEGQLYTRQKQLMRPLQERVLKAAEEVATEEGYDYVFDKAGKVLFVYARNEHDLSDAVLQRLGINPNQQTNGR